MREIFIDALHVFVIFMIGSFVILGFMAILGKFDHWTTRFIHRTRHFFGRMRRSAFRRQKREELHGERTPAAERPLYDNPPRELNPQMKKPA